jgi:hypothetical protein
MRQDIIIKVIAQDLGTSNIAKINEILKSKTITQVRYRIVAKKLLHLGCTGFIKNITSVGLKIFLPNKVRLIKFDDIELFEKAKPRSERPIEDKKPFVAPKKVPQKKEPKQSESKLKEPIQKSANRGSRFIPSKPR